MAVDRGDLVTGVFCEVLERFAFLFGTPAGKATLPRPPSRCISARLRFSGDRDGSMVLAVPAALCVEVAANVLGIDPDDERAGARAADALKELLNVACAHILTAIAGDRPVFDFSVPETVPIDLVGWRSVLAAEDSVGFLVDECPVLVAFTLKEPS